MECYFIILHFITCTFQPVPEKNKRKQLIINTNKKHKKSKYRKFPAFFSSGYTSFVPWIRNSLHILLSSVRVLLFRPLKPAERWEGLRKGALHFYSHLIFYPIIRSAFISIDVPASTYQPVKILRIPGKHPEYPPGWNK